MGISETFKNNFGYSCQESGRPSNKTNNTQGNLFILVTSMDDDRESKALMLKSLAILLKKGNKQGLITLSKKG